MRRLHFAGGCGLVAGEHYREWEDLGQATPPVHLYTARCCNCFPPPKQPIEPDDTDSEEDASASTSSSGEEAGDPAAETAA